MRRNQIIISLTIFSFLAFTACSFNLGGANAAPADNSVANTGTAPNNVPSANAVNSITPPPQSGAAAGCPEAKQSGKRFIKSQSFPFDFKPYEGSCFVTFASIDDMVNERDVPRGSTFYLYRDGKQAFAFPDAFGGQHACWIEGVSFKDLNGDGLTDVVLAGSCLAAKDSYPSNAIYVNTGTGFTTDDAANAKLENLSKLKDIETYARKNVKVFFK
ncbi:hypothetical protein BH10ACI2_BH10ACI2_24840 [soil metagenome]